MLTCVENITRTVFKGLNWNDHPESEELDNFTLNIERQAMFPSTAFFIVYLNANMPPIVYISFGDDDTHWYAY